MAEKTLPLARHEPKDVGGAFIGGGVALVVVVVIVLALLVVWLFPNALTDRSLHLPLSAYPNPQLQANPPADRTAFYRSEMQRLNSTGWIDKAHGIAHIPIADAMREVAKEGIAGWPKPPERQK